MTWPSDRTDACSAIETQPGCSPSTARPSYSSCASAMVRTPPKPSRCDASCCSVDVVNGAAGLRLDP